MASVKIQQYLQLMPQGLVLLLQVCKPSRRYASLPARQHPTGTHAAVCGNMKEPLLHMVTRRLSTRGSARQLGNRSLTICTKR